MNISFKGITYLTGPKKEIKAQLHNNISNNNISFNTINKIDNKNWKLIKLTRQDALKCAKDTFGIKLSKEIGEGKYPKTFKERLKAIFVATKMLLNYKKVEAFMAKQKAAGAQIEEIKL